MTVTLEAKVWSALSLISCTLISTTEAGLLDAINILNNGNNNQNPNTGLLLNHNLINIPSLINTNNNNPRNSPSRFNLLHNDGSANGNPNQNKEAAATLAESQKLLKRLEELNRRQEEERVNNATSEVGKDHLQENDKKQGGVLKSITKKRFYLQARPVIPENEMKAYDETVFYFD